MKISKDRLKKGRKPVKSKDTSTGIRVKTDTAEMDHTPNKQSKTDSTDRLPEDFTCAGASQRDVFDTEYERPNIGSQFESQSGYQGSVCNFPKKGSTSYSAASFSAVNFPSNRPTSTATSCGSTVKQISIDCSVTANGDNHHPSIACPPSQPDSTLDLGYSSTSTGSSYQGQDNNSQRDNLTVDQGSQLDLPMSQGASWSDGNIDESSLYGENELEDLLYRFQNYFENRLEAEINQFKESVRSMIVEQQNHVRQIVQRVACTRNQNSQNSTEEPEKNLPDSSQPKSDIVSRLLDGTLYIPDEQLKNFRLNRQTWTSRYEKRTKLLELLADSCSLSTLLAKPEYR